MCDSNFLSIFYDRFFPAAAVCLYWLSSFLDSLLFVQLAVSYLLYTLFSIPSALACKFLVPLLHSASYFCCTWPCAPFLSLLHSFLSHAATLCKVIAALGLILCSVSLVALFSVSLLHLIVILFLCHCFTWLFILFCAIAALFSVLAALGCDRCDPCRGRKAQWYLLKPCRWLERGGGRMKKITRTFLSQSRTAHGSADSSAQAAQECELLTKICTSGLLAGQLCI